ncbi:MAG: peptidylprolyl isomerase [Bacteroidales bacterium]|nr:peptidylprolyl isomerase [Bacteroidales bacterium]MDE6112685.1 peptidylprolyl isomerase [Bacteroidales bacterium]
MNSAKRPMVRLMAGILFLTTVITMAQAQTKVRIETPYGDMVVKLYDETPKHRDNFIKLVKEGFYDNLLFHRVIENFMIQGGDPDSKGAPAGKMLGVGDVGYTVPAEFVKGLYHKKGALSAARQGDAVNPAKASSGCQFYIVQGQVYPQEMFAMFESRGLKLNDEQKQLYSTVGGTPHLDGDYTVFGEVIEGLDVIDKIAAVQTDRADRPVEDVWMKMRIEK